MSYQLSVDKRPAYLHAKVVGKRTPENALRYLQEVYSVCVNNNYTAVLLDMNFRGPSLSTTEIFDVVLQRVPDALRLRKIAYVEGVPDDPAMPAFAETVAVNRGVNVRRFQNVADAANWLSYDV
jgi:hypothetical protein